VKNTLRGLAGGQKKTERPGKRDRGVRVRSGAFAHCCCVLVQAICRAKGKHREGGVMQSCWSGAFREVSPACDLEPG